jgi:hypothetical protein
MRSLRAWLAYLAVVFLGGALLAPWLYRAAQAAAESFPACQSLAAKPFHRFVNRSLLGLALAGLWPLLRRCGLRSWRDLGWTSSTGRWRPVWRGVLVGFAGLGLAGGTVLAAGARIWRAEILFPDLALAVAGAAVTALAVAVIEETLFRGVLQGTFRRAWNPLGALWLSSVVYAALHFLARVRWNEPVEWTSGLAVLVRMLAGFSDSTLVFPGFLNLVLAGALLGAAFERTGSLYFSAGLHAGWVFWLKLYNATTCEVAGAFPRLWGSGKLTDGWIALPALALTATVLPLALRDPRPARVA